MKSSEEPTSISQRPSMTASSKGPRRANEHRIRNGSAELTGARAGVGPAPWPPRAGSSPGSSAGNGEGAQALAMTALLQKDDNLRAGGCRQGATPGTHHAAG